MGSISDLPVMEPCIELLKNNNIKVQVDIVSAHRSPKWLYEFGDNIESWCGRVIIAGAGGVKTFTWDVSIINKYSSNWCTSTNK